MVKTAPGLSDGSSVGQHADGAVDGRELAVWDAHRLLVVDTKLESSGAPLNQVERGLGLDRRNGGRAVAGHNVSTVQQGNRHVLAVARVADNHLVVRLEACKHRCQTLRNHHY